MLITILHFVLVKPVTMPARSLKIHKCHNMVVYCCVPIKNITVAIRHIAHGDVLLYMTVKNKLFMAETQRCTSLSDAYMFDSRQQDHI